MVGWPRKSLSPKRTEVDSDSNIERLLAQAESIKDNPDAVLADEAVLA